jgi:hypothetical protein
MVSRSEQYNNLFTKLALILSPSATRCGRRSHRIMRVDVKVGIPWNTGLAQDGVLESSFATHA